MEARRSHFIDFFNPQAYKETKLQEVEIGSGSGEVSQVLGGWFGQPVLRSFSFGVDLEARRHHFLDFFDPQANRETKLQNEAANGPELNSF